MASVQQSKKEKPDDPNKELNLRQNPLDNNKNPFNVLLFFFIQPLIVLGTKKALEMSDMIRLPFSDLTAQAWKRLETQIERERKLITDEERKKVAETKKTSG